MFTTCAGVWDKDTQIWNDVDVTDVAKCCTKECMNQVATCYDYCNEHKGAYQTYNTPMLLYRCMKTCEDQRNICLDTCSLSSKHVGRNNNYIDCANMKGCTGLGIPNVECLLKNKQDIFNCCTMSCIPSEYLDCEKNCKYLESVYLNPLQELEFPVDSRAIISTYTKNEFKQSYILFGFIGILIFSVIIIFLCLKRK